MILFSISLGTCSHRLPIFFILFPIFSASDLFSKNFLKLFQTIQHRSRILIIKYSLIKVNESTESRNMDVCECRRISGYQLVRRNEVTGGDTPAFAG